MTRRVGHGDRFHRVAVGVIVVGVLRRRTPRDVAPNIFLFLRMRSRRTGTALRLKLARGGRGRTDDVRQPHRPAKK